MAGAVIVWLVTAVVLGIIEGLTVALVCIWMAVAAVAAAVAAALNASIMVQILVFAVVSVVLLILTAPLSRKFRHGKRIRTNADRLFGQKGVVIRKIDSVENKGQIKVMGQVWSASGKDGQSFACGEEVLVDHIEGVHAVVTAVSDK
ncbi:NfeD family protein [Ructibacterium gallinarum]|uniref:NfeD family protein n=1 Tax=Ructibacterium gallinarum TaxID=2779355 RepID=A0A9D5R8B9_9FIRM|nr:NfeD family protein [Ructibacterium gallinarum]MBE5040256.1 NfeD family protein [Ructibacterium gallinarum]